MGDIGSNINVLKQKPKCKDLTTAFLDAFTPKEPEDNKYSGRHVTSVEILTAYHYLVIAIPPEVRCDSGEGTRCPPERQNAKSGKVHPEVLCPYSEASH